MGLPDEKIAHEVFDVLVMCAGAREDDRATFVQSHLREDYPCDEFRFGGHFGFGGKFYSHDSKMQPWRIGYHPDDFVGNKNEDVYHSLMIAINAVLLSIWEKCKRSIAFQCEAGERFDVVNNRECFDAFVEGAEYGHGFSDE